VRYEVALNPPFIAASSSHSSQSLANFFAQGLQRERFLQKVQPGV